MYLSREPPDGRAWSSHWDTSLASRCIRSVRSTPAIAAQAEYRLANSESTTVHARPAGILLGAVELEIPAEVW
jgi:hypothetical protein